jgi:predicted XRE-type DNA-binding protein
MALKIERSSGNVFLDVGFPHDVAANLLLRSELSVELLRIIKARKLTQEAAARLFGVSQPRISDLVRGKLELFSIDGLVNMLAAAGLTLKVTVHPQTRGPAKARKAAGARTR